MTIRHFLTSLFVINTPIEELIQPIILSDKASLDREFDNGSGIEIDSYIDTQLSSLYKLAKIWGFVKYHHPDVAQGNHNWDYELFRVLPSIIGSTSRDPTNQRIETWLNNPFYGVGEQSLIDTLVPGGRITSWCGSYTIYHW